MTEAFAVVGAFATFAVAVIFIGAVVIVVIQSIKEWLQTKKSLTHSTENLVKTQSALMKANNKLNERVRALEEGRGECEVVESASDGLCSDNPRHWYRLSCGHSFTIDGLEKPVTCAVCGKAVKR